MQGDAKYFTRRFREEQQAALSADNRSVRLRHLEFAQAYEFRARELRALERRAVLNGKATGSFDDPLNTIYEQIATGDGAPPSLQEAALDAQDSGLSAKQVR